MSLNVVEMYETLVLINIFVETDKTFFFDE